MRHGKTHNHLGRTSSHRAALLMNLANSLILHKRITTTVAKAKELRKYVEPLLTRSKDDSTHSRRTVFAYLKDKDAVKELYASVADKIADRPGGYTRIIKLGTRQGDNADMCIIELVDFNTIYGNGIAEDKSAKKRTRRGRTSAGATVAADKVAAAAVAAPVVEAAAEEVAVAEEVTATEVVAEEEVTTAAVEETTPEVEASAADEETTTDSESEEKKEE